MHKWVAAVAANACVVHYGTVECNAVEVGLLSGCNIDGACYSLYNIVHSNSFVAVFCRFISFLIWPRYIKMTKVVYDTSIKTVRVLKGSMDNTVIQCLHKLQYLKTWVPICQIARLWQYFDVQVQVCSLYQCYYLVPKDDCSLLLVLSKITKYHFKLSELVK